MGLFDRFRKNRDDDAAAAADADDLDEDLADEETDDEETASAADSVEDEDDDGFEKEAPRDRATAGPFDSSEEATKADRLNLGALSIPVIDGMQVRLESQERSDAILAVTLIHKGAGVQLQAFAAPRGEGLWKEVRGEIARSVDARRGTWDEIYTTLGTELLTRIPVRGKDGRNGQRIARFAGVDGPRWFLRAVFSGKALVDDELRDDLVAVVRGTIVDRGEKAMPPRELLPLAAPDMPAPPQQQAEAEDDDPNPFERGPEITEVR